MHSDWDGPVPDAASDFPFDFSSEDLDAEVSGRLCDILEDEVNDAYSLSSSKLGSGLIDPWFMREDRYCEDL